MMNNNFFSITFVFEVPITIQNRTRLKNFISQQLLKEGKSGGHIVYLFCSDNKVRTVNKTYLNHDYYTDIVTFQLTKNRSVYTEAEIYISADRIRENAKTFNSTINKELHRVIFHGALHLLGYKDKTPKQEKQMRQKEDEWLSLYFA